MSSQDRGIEVFQEMKKMNWGIDSLKFAGQLIPTLASLANEASDAVSFASQNPSNTSAALQAQMAMATYQGLFTIISNVVANVSSTMKDAIGNIR